jgi:segregation and condensation protein B
VNDDEQPGSLADQAAAWIPPWQRTTATAPVTEDDVEEDDDFQQPETDVAAPAPQDPHNFTEVAESNPEDPRDFTDVVESDPHDLRDFTDVVGSDVHDLRDFTDVVGSDVHDLRDFTDVVESDPHDLRDFTEVAESDALDHSEAIGTIEPDVDDDEDDEEQRPETDFTAAETAPETIAETAAETIPDADADAAAAAGAGAAITGAAGADDASPLPEVEPSVAGTPEILENPDRPANLAGALEAILLVVDEPVPPDALAEVLSVSTEEANAALAALALQYADESRGFDLRRAAGGWRLYTRTEYASYVERFVLDGQSVRLTQAALETLAVIAYQQPVTRSRMSAIRGVNCDGVVRTLANRGLIEECGTQPESGAFLYRTTPLFLEKLGLDSLDELPPLAPFLPDDVNGFADA